MWEDRVNPHKTERALAWAVWLIRGRAAKTDGQKAQTHRRQWDILANGLRATPLCYYISLAVVARQSVEASLDRGINTDLSEVWTSDNRNHADGRVPIRL